MTHDELLVKVGSLSCCSGAHELALRAVVELHKPKTAGTGVPYLYCTNCQEPYSYGRYPCPTIQAIEKELNGQT
jgi:hypothetical protein